MSFSYKTWQLERVNSSIRQERGEDYVDYVRRNTSTRRLVDPERLVHGLANLNNGTPHRTICNVILHQYEVARDVGDWRWIEALRRECSTILCSARWVDDHLPSLVHETHSQKRVRPSVTASSATPASMCVDIHLRSNLDLQFERENTVDGKHQTPYVTPVMEASAYRHGFSKECPVSTREDPYLNENFHYDKTKPKTITSAHTVEANEGSMEIPSKRVRLDCDYQELTQEVKLQFPSSFQKCPFLGCDVREKKIKRHAQSKHLPRIFNDIKPIRSLDDKSLCQLQMSALSSLVKSALGPDADLLTAVDYLNCSNIIPSNAVVHVDTASSMHRLCSHQGWMEPSEGFRLSPINSPAVLVHWRCLVALMSLLQPMQCEEFRVHGRVISDMQSVTNTSDIGGSNVNTLTEDNFKVFDVHYGSDFEIPYQPVPHVVSHSKTNALEVQESSTSNVNEAFDSHFHLDHTCARIWGHYSPSGNTMEDLHSVINQSSFQPKLKVNIVGGVINYSEPSAHPEFIQAGGSWGIALGVHPKHVSELTAEKLLRLKNLLDHPSVVGLGETGLDRTVPVKLWRQQEKVFRQVLSLVRQNKVLILHLRGTPADRIGIDVHARCMQILKKFCGYTQPIHVHCFTGDTELVTEWMSNFSNVYFGFTGAVENFSSDQVAGLQSVPLNRILLETDSPSMRPGGGNINTPAFIGDVASLVASKLQIPEHRLLKETVQNGHRLYGC